MTAASLALQQAVYSALVAFAPLTAAITGVFDMPPQDQPLPYVSIGDDVVVDYSTKDVAASEHRISIHIWSRKAGRQEAKQLMALVQNALAAPLTLTGFKLISLRFLQAINLVDPDGLTHHGVIEFRVRIFAL